MDEAQNSGADIAGIYSMVTMKAEAIRFARALRDKALVVAGGPLPSCDPAAFTGDFDLVVKGEGEQAILDIVESQEQGKGYDNIPGVVYKKDGIAVFNSARQPNINLDAAAFPARDLFPNEKYVDYYRQKTGYATTSIMTSRGCPFSCEFCSNAVFGVSYRERSAASVVDEVEQALTFGYNRIHFGDDVFTLRKERVMQVCEEIMRRRLKFRWECLGRVDSIDKELVDAMKAAGCDRIFFGIESADDSVLKLMNKKITVARARAAVETARDAGIRTGGFFILCYPGETDDTVLKTLRFATSLPLDYLSFTMPYPLPGTALYERVKDRVTREWDSQKRGITDHTLTFDADFSQAKMKFAILKGQVEFALRKALGPRASFIIKPLTLLNDSAFRLMR
jgi:anaerobic magnesium-protoporphyrin IX monomethyl ester cyclase